MNSARSRGQLGIARTWREAWRIAESNPLVLLVALMLLAGTVEACVQSGYALAGLVGWGKYGFAVSWLTYFGTRVMEQTLIVLVSASIVMGMLVKGESGEAFAQGLSRSLMTRYFLRVVGGWFCLLVVTWTIVSFANGLIQIASLMSERPLEQAFDLAMLIGFSVGFAVLNAGFASLLFLRLPDTLAGTRHELLRGERRRFFLLCATSFLATGLTVGLAEMYWRYDLSLIASLRLVDAKIALDSLLVFLLSFAARRQLAADPSVISVFD